MISTAVRIFFFASSLFDVVGCRGRAFLNKALLDNLSTGMAWLTILLWVVRGGGKRPMGRQGAQSGSRGLVSKFKPV